MPGPNPKAPELRQRRNKTSTRATLPSEAEAADQEVPELPKLVRGKWHPMVLQWWNDAWTSPMAPEFLKADRHRMYRVAVLIHDFWKAKDPADRLKIGAELRQQEAPLGITPMDRRRLQWEVNKGDEAEEKSTARRRRKELDAAEKKDPRDILKRVS